MISKCRKHLRSGQDLHMEKEVEAYKYVAPNFSVYVPLKHPLLVFRYSVSCGTGGVSMKAMQVVKGVLTCTLHLLMLEL